VRWWRTIFFCSGGGEFPHELRGQKRQQSGRAHGLAFDSGGLPEIEKHKDNIGPDQLKGWRKIAEGIKKDNEELINDGNQLLFQHEQKVTLQKQVYDEYPRTFNTVGDYGENVVPHLTDDKEFWSFRRHQPKGNWSNADDRWSYLGGPVWSDWLHVGDKKPGEVKAEVKKLVVP
jgi:hypothetical protein